MKKRNLTLALLLSLLTCTVHASTPKEIKARFSQFKVGDKTICLDEFTYPDNQKMKPFENGFVVSKKNNVLTYQIVSMFLLGNDVTANVKAIVESRAGKNGLSTTFKQAFIDVSGMDRPEQAEAKAKLIREFEQMTSAKQDVLPYSAIVLNDQGYVITTVETNGTSVSECFVTPYKTPTKE